MDSVYNYCRLRLYPNYVEIPTLSVRKARSIFSTLIFVLERSNIYTDGLQYSPCSDIRAYV